MAKFAVVVLTAVHSSLGAEGSGAFVKVDGRECLLRAVDLFVNRDGIGQILVVVGPDKAEDAKQRFGGHLSFSGAKLIAGGASWNDQLAAVGDKLSAESTHVIVHDGARPAIAYTDLEALMSEAEKHPVVMMTVASRGGLVETEETGKPLYLHSGKNYQQVVTPWALRKDRFAEMVAAKRDPAPADIWLLRSSALNIRVVSAIDASIAKSMINLLPKPKIRAADNPFEEAQW